MSVKLVDSVFKAKEKYYPQTLLVECKHKPKKKKMENFIDDYLEKSSTDESDNEDDNDSNEKMESDNDDDESNK